MAFPALGDERLNAGAFTLRDVGAAVVAGVGQQHFDVTSASGRAFSSLQGGGDFQLVVGVLGDVVLDDQMGVDVDTGLRVVGLLETAAGAGMMRDWSSVRLTWSLAFGPGSGALRWLAARLLAGLLLARFTLGLPAFEFALLGREARLGAGADLGLGRRDHVQSLLAPLQLQRDVQLFGQRLLISLFGQRIRSLTSPLSGASRRLAYSQLSALCLLALALILVPSRLTVPSLTNPIVCAISRISTNNASSSARKRFLKSAMVRWSGWVLAQMKRNAIES